MSRSSTQFLKEFVELCNNYKNSVLLGIREMQVKTVLIFHLRKWIFNKVTSAGEGKEEKEPLFTSHGD